MIAEHAPSIVDTRNALEDVTDADLQSKIRLLGGGTPVGAPSAEFAEEYV